MTIVLLVTLGLLLYPGVMVVCFAVVSWRLSRIEKRLAGLYRR